MPREFVSAREEPDVPSNTFSWFFKEAIRRLWVSKRTSFVAIAMIAISLLILGCFLLVAENLSRAVAQWQGTSRVIVYLDPEATPAQIATVDRFLSSRAELSHRRFVTSAQALARFKTWFSNMSEVVAQLDENPFPASFEIDVAPDSARALPFRRLMETLRATPGVDQVQYDWDWIERLRKVVNVINIAGLVAGGILAVAAAFTIANVIRLTMMLYREEIEIMRLVGATERIIRGPFIVEGFLQGTIGGIVAVLLLYAIFELSRRALAPSLIWSFLFTGFLPWQKIAALIGGGMFAGWFGSWLSVRVRSEA
jgi:cell division transport system permease protein